MDLCGRRRPTLVNCRLPLRDRRASIARGAGFDIVWRSFAAVAEIGAVFFAIALLRFRRATAIS